MSKRERRARKQKAWKQGQRSAKSMRVVAKEMYRRMSAVHGESEILSVRGRPTEVQRWSFTEDRSKEFCVTADGAVLVINGLMCGNNGEVYYRFTNLDDTPKNLERLEH